MSLSFRWLGAAGVELRADGQVLALDPFFTRPSLIGLIRPVRPDAGLVAEKLPRCDAVLVTHAHWDHVMDVPEVVRQTHARAYGSVNTCQLLRLEGLPEQSFSEVSPGDKLSLGAFRVEVLAGRHSRIPLGRVFNGCLKPHLQPPLRLQDYRMDTCLGYCITAQGRRVLVCADQPQPAEVLLIVAQEPRQYYVRLFEAARPQTIIPIHWDNFLRPLSRPVRRFTRPGRLELGQLCRLARRLLPEAKVIIPEIFKEYSLVD